MTNNILERAKHDLQYVLDNFNVSDTVFIETAKETIRLLSEGGMSYCEDDCICPNCGHLSSDSMEEAMKGVWMYHHHYCQKCGCSFKILRRSRRR